MNFTKTGAPTNSESQEFVSLYNQEGFPCGNSLVFYTLLEQPIINRTFVTKHQNALRASTESTEKIFTPPTELSRDELKCNHGFKPMFSSPTLVLNDEFYLTFHPKQILKPPNAKELVPPSTSIEFENTFLKLYDPNYIEVTNYSRSDFDVTQKNTTESIFLYQEQHTDRFSSEISMESDCGSCSDNSIREQKSLQDIVILISGFFKEPVLQDQKGKESRCCSCDLEQSLLLKENCKRLKNNIIYGNSNNNFVSDTFEFSNNCNRKCVTNLYNEGLNEELKTTNSQSTEKVMKNCEDVGINKCARLNLDGSFSKGTIEYFENIFYKKWDKHKGLNGRTDCNYLDTKYNKAKDSVEWLAELVLRQKNRCSRVTFNKEKIPKRNVLENGIKQSKNATGKICCLEPKPIKTFRNRVTEVTSRRDTNSKSKIMFPKNGHYFGSRTPREYIKFSADHEKCSNGCQCDLSSNSVIKNEESQWDETKCQKTLKSKRFLDEFNIKPTRSAQTKRNTKDTITNTDESFNLHCYDLFTKFAPQYLETYDVHQNLFKTLVSVQNNNNTFSKTQNMSPNISKVLNVDQDHTNVSTTAQNLMNIILKSETLVPITDTEDLCTKRLSIPITQRYHLSKSEPSLNCSNVGKSCQSQNSKKSLSDHALLLPKNECINCNLLFVFGNNATSQICYRCSSKYVRSLIKTIDNKVINLTKSRETNKALGPCEEKERYSEQFSLRPAESCTLNPQKSNSISTYKRFIRILKNKFKMFDTIMSKIRSKFMKAKCNNVLNKTQIGTHHCKSEKKRKSSYVNLQKNKFSSEPKEINVFVESYAFNIFDMDKKFNDIKDISITGQLGPSWDDVKKRAKEMRVKNLKPKNKFLSYFRKPTFTTCDSSTLGRYNILSQNSSTVSAKYLDTTIYKPNLQKEKTNKQLQSKTIDPMVLKAGINSQNRSGTLIKAKCINPPLAINKNKKENLIFDTGMETTGHANSLKKNKKRKVKFSTNIDPTNNLQTKNKNALLDPTIIEVLQRETIYSEPENVIGISACVGLSQCEKKYDPSIDKTHMEDLEKYIDLDQTPMLVSKNLIECHDNHTLRKTIPKRMKYTQSTNEKSIYSGILQPTSSEAKLRNSFELSDQIPQKHLEASQIFEKAKKKPKLLENSAFTENNSPIIYNPKSRQRDQYSSTDNATEPNFRKRSGLHPSKSDNTIDTLLDQLVLGSNIKFYSESSPNEFLQEMKKELNNELSSCYQRGDDKTKEKLSHFIKFIDGKLGSDTQHASSISDSLMSDLSQERVIRQILYSGSS